MKIEIGDLVFCHTIGNKYAWRLNQVAIVTEANSRKARYRAFLLTSGVYDEFTGVDLKKENVEVIAKANGKKIKLNEKIRVIPDFSKMSITDVYR